MLKYLISSAQKSMPLRVAIGLLTVFFYAFQHPMTNPFYRSVAQSNYGKMEALLISEIAILLAYVLLLFIPEVRNGALRVIRNWTSFGAIAISMMAGFGGLYFYIVAQSALSPPELSMILNASPITSVAIAAVISKKAFRLRYFALAAFLSLFAISLTYINERENSEWTFNFGAYSAALMTPALFFTSIQIIAEKFKKDAESLIGAITLAAIIGSSIAIIFISYIFIYSGKVMQYSSIDPNLIMLLIIGTLVPALFGRIVYHISLELSNQSQEEISVNFYLIPAFTVAITYIMALVLPHYVDKPKLYQLFGVIAVVFALAIYHRTKSGGD